MEEVHELPSESVLRKSWNWFRQLDIFIKLYFVTMLLILMAIPIVVTQQTSLFSRAANDTPIAYESYKTINNQDNLVGTVWKGQSFTPSVSHYITKVRLPLLRVGNPAGNVTVGIRKTDANGLPTGSDLTTGSIPCANLIAAWSPTTWYDINLTTAYKLEAGTKYAIIISATSASSTNMVYYHVNTAGTYAGGQLVYSSDNGTIWKTGGNYAGWDVAFEEWGTAIDLPTLTPVPTTTSSFTSETTQTAIAYESYKTLNDQDNLSGVVWKGQSFTPSVSHYITKVRLPLLRVGNPAGNVTVGIRKTDASGLPTGSNLTTGSIPCSSFIAAWSPVTWYDIALTAYKLDAGTKYAIIISAPRANSTNMVYYHVNTAGTYSGGQFVYSSNSGTAWRTGGNYTGWDIAFEEWGTGGSSTPALVTVAPTSTPKTTLTPTAAPTSIKPTSTPVPTSIPNQSSVIRGLTMFYYGSNSSSQLQRIKAAAPEFVVLNTPGGSYKTSAPTPAQIADLKSAGIKVLSYIATGGMRGYRWQGGDASFKTYQFVYDSIEAVKNEGCNGIYFDEGGRYEPVYGQSWHSDTYLDTSLQSQGGVSGYDDYFDYNVGQTWAGYTIKTGYLDHARNLGLIVVEGIDDNRTSRISENVWSAVDFVLTAEEYAGRALGGAETGHGNQCWAISYDLSNDDSANAQVAANRTKTAWAQGFRGSYNINMGTLPSWFEQYITLLKTP
jgi:hypothetical protein